jgi:hypothetical protein
MIETDPGQAQVLRSSLQTIPRLATLSKPHRGSLSGYLEPWKNIDLRFAAKIENKAGGDGQRHSQIEG